MWLLWSVVITAFAVLRRARCGLLGGLFRLLLVVVGVLAGIGLLPSIVVRVGACVVEGLKELDVGGRVKQGVGDIVVRVLVEADHRERNRLDADVVLVHLFAA
jgi:hypothetical protein